MKKLILPLSIAVTLVACTEKKEDLIAKRWQVSSWESPVMDSMVRENMAFIDTFGTNTPGDYNKNVYGVEDVTDSFRTAVRANFDEQVAMERHARENTIFEFKKDSVVYITVSDQTDSAKWYINKEDKLIIDNMTPEPQGDKFEMEIVNLTKEEMKVKLKINDDNSTIVFKPATESKENAEK